MKEFVFETRQGDKLIGVTIEQKEDDFVKMFGLPGLFSKESLDGVFIYRTRFKKITYLSQDEIIRIRPATVFDTEYDTALGIGTDA